MVWIAKLRWILHLRSDWFMLLPVRNMNFPLHLAKCVGVYSYKHIKHVIRMQHVRHPMIKYLHLAARLNRRINYLIYHKRETKIEKKNRKRCCKSSPNWNWIPNDFVWTNERNRLLQAAPPPLAVAVACTDIL